MVHLQVHLEGQQPVYFPDGLGTQDLALRMEESSSTLLAFFEYNRLHADRRDILYPDFPVVCVYNQQTKKWQPRKKGRSIGRIYHCTPVAGERYYL